MSGQVLARQSPGHRTHRPRKKAEAVRNGRYFVVQHGQVGFAAVERFQPGQLLGVRVACIGQLQEHQRTVFGGGLRPGLKGLVRSHNRLLDLLHRGLGQLQEYLAGGRVVDVQRGALPGHKLAAY
jgi:hypothetical protein